MAAVLGSVVGAPGLHFAIREVWNSSSASGRNGDHSTRTSSRGRRSGRQQYCGLSSSEPGRLTFNDLKQSRGSFSGSSTDYRREGPQPTTGLCWECSARASDRDLSIGALAIEKPALVHSKDEEDEGEVEEDVPYNWRTEWYPLYLENEIPRDAPLSVKVYDHNLVLFYDGQGDLNCLEDHCPHRAAKLSDGQVIDGTLECLYHGWQFKGDGACVKIPQLAAGAVIPKKACAKSYALKVSQDVVWVWMADKSSADESKLPFFENYLAPGYTASSTIHEFPYDHSILVENVLDPAHVHISHDRTDFSAKREKAEALKFEVTERTARGFACTITIASNPAPYFYRFQAPSIVRNERTTVDKDGIPTKASGTFLIRPTGQGKCSIIIRFGTTAKLPKWFTLLPSWITHMIGTKIFEEDMNFLAAQNETMIRRGIPTEDLYLNLRSSDTMVMEYRKWLDKVGQGMPYYFGHKTLLNSPIPAVQEIAPAGLEAYSASTMPSKGAFGHLYCKDPTNRYFRHIVHCKSCRTSLDQFRLSEKASVALAVITSAVAIMLSNSRWKAALVLSALALAVYSRICNHFANSMTQNHIRSHRA